MRPLYAIGQDLVKLDEILDDVEGDLSRLGEAEAAFVEWASELFSEEERKVDNYVAYIKRIRMELAAAESEAEEWVRRAKALAAREKFLMERLARHMEARKLDKLRGNTSRINLVSNGGVVPIELDPVIDLDGIDERFITTQTLLCNSEVRKALESGESVPFARFGERGKHVRVY